MWIYVVPYWAHTGPYEANLDLTILTSPSLCFDSLILWPHRYLLDFFWPPHLEGAPRTLEDSMIFCWQQKATGQTWLRPKYLHIFFESNSEVTTVRTVRVAQQGSTGLIQKFSGQYFVLFSQDGLKLVPSGLEKWIVWDMHDIGILWHSTFHILCNIYIYIYMNIMQHIKSISMLYTYNLYHSTPYHSTPGPPMVPSAVPSTQIRCVWQDRFVGRSILAVAGVLHSPETSDDLLIELDDSFL